MQFTPWPLNCRHREGVADFVSKDIRERVISNLTPDGLQDTLTTCRFRGKLRLIGMASQDLLVVGSRQALKA